MIARCAILSHEQKITETTLVSIPPRSLPSEVFYLATTWTETVHQYGRPDDDRIVSHDAPRFLLYYHCVHDTSWSVIFSTHEVNSDRSARCGWFPNMFLFSSFCFWDYRVGLYSLCFKGEFQRCFDWEGFYMYFTDLSRTTCAALGRTVNTNYKTRNW